MTVEIDGKPLLGEFHVESEWNGLLKLKSEGPIRTIIIKKPNRPGNPWDFISHIFGGGQSPEKMEVVEVEIIQRDFQLPSD